VFLLLALSACQSVALTTPSDTSVIEALEAAHNAQDVDAVLDLYAENGVEKNTAGTFRGTRRLRDLYETAVLAFKVDNTNIRIDGDKVVYDCVMFSKDGRQMGAVYEAKVENGKIKSNILIGSFVPG
jgi:hypothetical protein